MKRFLAIMLAAGMFMSSAASAMTRTEFIESSGLGEVLVPKTLNVAVDADITVRETDDTEFEDGPINIVKKSSEDFPVFDFRADLYMDKVRDAFKWYYEKALLVTPEEDMEELENTPVTGQFTVKATFPDDLVIPDIMTQDLKQETGFGAEVNTVFEEVSRTLEDSGSNNKVLTIVMNVAGIERNGVRETLTCKDLSENLETYLPDLYLQCDDAETTAYGTYKVIGFMEGYTHIGDESDPISTVYYNAVQKGEKNDKNLYAKVSVARRSTGGGPSGPSGPSIVTPPSADDVTVIFDIAGDTSLVDPVTGRAPFDLNLDEVKAPKIEGYKFDGWHEDKAYIVKADGTKTITKDTIYYGKYSLIDPIDVFDTGGEHNLYIMGYPDGSVQPNGNITREEVAKALYRLLRRDIRQSITVEESMYPDVAQDRWSNVSISSMTNAGYIKGYEDGTFRPGSPITRAEFATIALRFFKDIDTNIVGLPYTDISGHWAENNIIAAKRKFIIQGYEDMTFRPDNYITRAEAMTIINRLTVRHTDANGLIAGFRDWPDIQPTDWYYYEILEATNPHTFERRGDGYLENWTALLENEFLIEDK